jgi:hypothetical protein
VLIGQLFFVVSLAFFLCGTVLCCEKRFSPKPDRENGISSAGRVCFVRPGLLQSHAVGFEAHVRRRLEMGKGFDNCLVAHVGTRFFFSTHLFLGFMFAINFLLKIN